MAATARYIVRRKFVDPKKLAREILRGHRSAPDGNGAAASSSTAGLLFDAEYYVATYPDVKRAKNAWEHFLRWGAKEGRNPHALFDTAFYLRRNPDVALSGKNPLLHYVTQAADDCRGAHPLFDEQFYLREHADVRESGRNPLLHFLERGAKEAYDPNRLFDVKFYLTENPDVAKSGVNPLVHYVQSGALEGRDPHPLFGSRDYLERYPDVARSGVNPLRHYLEDGERERRMVRRPLLFSDRVAASGKSSSVKTLATRQPRVDQPVPVFCVYGPGNVTFLKALVIPAFSHQHVPFPIELHFLNYRSAEALIETCSSESGPVVGIKDWSDTRPPGHLGFGESMNYLFAAVNPPDCFVVCNPDSFPMPNCLARLADCYFRERPGMVEASQWPSSHPKEFNPVTHETPWASGAFALVSAEAFKELQGFDTQYFLYLEDVDLSWRAWLKGYRVLHEPLALCGHATGLHSYRTGRFYYEHFFSMRNFVVISYKFFGAAGERSALEHLKRVALPKPLHSKILDSYYSMRDSIPLQPSEGHNAEMIKILGLNLFHELRQ